MAVCRAESVRQGTANRRQRLRSVYGRPLAAEEGLFGHRRGASACVLPKGGQRPRWRNLMCDEACAQPPDLAVARTARQLSDEVQCIGIIAVHWGGAGKRSLVVGTGHGGQASCQVSETVHCASRVGRD